MVVTIPGRMGDRTRSTAHESGEYQSESGIDCDNRMYLVRASPARWSIPTVSCVLAMPRDTCSTIEQWEEIFDEIETHVRPLLAPKSGSLPRR